MRKFTTTLGDDGLSRLVREGAVPETSAEAKALRNRDEPSFTELIEGTVERQRKILVDQGWPDPGLLWVVREGIVTEPAPDPMPLELAYEEGIGAAELVWGYDCIIEFCEIGARALDLEWYRAMIVKAGVHALRLEGDPRDRAIYLLGFLERDAEWRFGHGRDTRYGRKTRAERRLGAKMRKRPDHDRILAEIGLPPEKWSSLR